MYRKIYELLEKNGKVKSAVLLNGKNMGSRAVFVDGECITKEAEQHLWKLYENVVSQTEETKIINVDESEIFVEIFLKNPRLVILGAGHVSVPVAKIGKMLGFHVTVMDDREEFLNRERFPDADVLVCGSFDEMTEKIPSYENTYYVVVTRGHQGDTVCARQILKRPHVYFGMIGSRNKVAIARKLLLQEGFSEKQLDSVYAPIGLPIGGQLPEEIAISIMAQIVQVKNRNYTAFTDEKIAAAVRERKKGVMTTIIQKSGSSPRGIGSKMLICSPREYYGSIGGGSVEYEAMKEAENVDGVRRRYYNLSINDKKNLGMICGGNVEILFEKV